jgi:hypothetical protein
MRPLLADFDPGTLTAFCSAFSAAVFIAIGLVGGGLSLLMKQRKAARYFFYTAAVLTGVAFLLACFALSIGKHFNWP